MRSTDRRHYMPRQLSIEEVFILFANEVLIHPWHVDVRTKKFNWERTEVYCPNVIKTKKNGWSTQYNFLTKKYYSIAIVQMYNHVFPSFFIKLPCCNQICLPMQIHVEFIFYIFYRTTVVNHSNATMHITIHKSVGALVARRSVSHHGGQLDQLRHWTADARTLLVLVECGNCEPLQVPLLSTATAIADLQAVVGVLWAKFAAPIQEFKLWHGSRALQF